MTRRLTAKYRAFERPQSAETRETLFNVEGVPAKLRLLHNLFENGTPRMYDDEVGCHDEFGPFNVLKNGRSASGDKYVKTGYTADYPNKNTYYYLNTDDSFYVMNPDGSEFFRHQDGSEWYVPAPQARGMERKSSSNNNSTSGSSSTTLVPLPQSLATEPTEVVRKTDEEFDSMVKLDEIKEEDAHVREEDTHVIRRSNSRFRGLRRFLASFCMCFPSEPED